MSDTTNGSAGRVVQPRQARARVRRKVDYPGRDRLDASLDFLRRSLLKVAQLAPTDESAARALDELIDQAVVEIDRIRAAADQALLRSKTGQAEVRRQVKIAEKMLRKAASPRARELAQRQLEYVRAMLVDQELTQ